MPCWNGSLCSGDLRLSLCLTSLLVICFQIIAGFLRFLDKDILIVIENERNKYYYFFCNFWLPLQPHESWLATASLSLLSVINLLWLNIHKVSFFLYTECSSCIYVQHLQYDIGRLSLSCYVYGFLKYSFASKHKP